MKLTPALLRLAFVAMLPIWPALRGADGPTDKPRNGYTVTLDVKVDEQGKPEGVKLVSTEDESAGDVLSKMAIAMAMQATFPPRLKDGVAHKYTARAPFFFPIEDDEGKAAESLPIPKVKNAVQPVYPTELRNQGVVGGAVFELIVDATGKLTNLRSMRASHPEFEKAARESLEKWEFAPAQKDGQPVESRSRVAVVFDTAKELADLKWRIPPRPKLGSFTVIRPEPSTTDEAAAGAAAPGDTPTSEPPPAVPPAPGK